MIKSDDDAERRYAQRVRLMNRFSWMVAAAGTALALGPLRSPWEVRAIVLALMLGVVLGLNVPAYRVVRRARREDAPERLVRILAATLTLRVGSAVFLAAALALE